MHGLYVIVYTYTEIFHINIAIIFYIYGKIQIEPLLCLRLCWSILVHFVNDYCTDKMCYECFIVKQQRVCGVY